MRRLLYKTLFYLISVAIAAPAAFALIALFPLAFEFWTTTLCAEAQLPKACSVPALTSIGRDYLQLFVIELKGLQLSTLGLAMIATHVPGLTLAYLVTPLANDAIEIENRLNVRLQQKLSDQQVDQTLTIDDAPALALAFGALRGGKPNARIAAAQVATALETGEARAVHMPDGSIVFRAQDTEELEFPSSLPGDSQHDAEIHAEWISFLASRQHRFPSVAIDRPSDMTIWIVAVLLSVVLVVISASSMLFDVAAGPLAALLFMAVAMPLYHAIFGPAWEAGKLIAEATLADGKIRQLLGHLIFSAVMLAMTAGIFAFVLSVIKHPVLPLTSGPPMGPSGNGTTLAVMLACVYWLARVRFIPRKKPSLARTRTTLTLTTYGARLAKRGLAQSAAQPDQMPPPLRIAVAKSPKDVHLPSMLLEIWLRLEAIDAGRTGKRAKFRSHSQGPDRGFGVGTG